jgi:hypothetical protein
MIDLPVVSKIYILLLLLGQYLKENILDQHDKIQLPSNRQIYRSSSWGLHYFLASGETTGKYSL